MAHGPAPTQDALESERAARLFTPERLPLTVPLAGLGERALAYGVDVALLATLSLAALFIYNFWGDIEQDLSALGGVGTTLLALLLYGTLLGYDVAFEVLWRGQTPGKRLLRLRVVTSQGAAPDVMTAVARNGLRLLDMLPVGYAVGTITLFFTGTRRLGDLVADTVVLSERARGQATRATLETLAAPAPIDLVAPRLPDDEVRAALALLPRVGTLEPAAADRLCKRALKRAAPGLLAAHPDVPARALLARALLSRTDRAGDLMHHLAALDDSRAALEDARQAALRAPDLATVEALDDALRQAGSRLMRATRRGVPPRALEAMSLALLDAERLRRLPAVGGHGLRRLFGHDLPGAVYAERGLVLRAAVAFFSALLVGGALAYADGSLGRALVGDSVALSIERGATWTDQAAQRGVFLYIIFNNIKVGVTAFAAGALWGAGTFLLLVFNGISIGSVFGYAIAVGHADGLFRFILAHGPTELTAICVAGAAGLCIGRGLLRPGSRSRLAALREEGARGVRLVGAAVVGFAVIGTVEGMVSPGTLFPVWANALVGVGVWLCFFAWVRVYGRRALATAAPRS